MDVTQMIVDFIHQNGLATGIVIALGWFLIGKVWPWYTKEYLPAASVRQDNRDKVITELRDAIIEIKMLTTQLMNTIEQYDNFSRDLANTLGSNQQAILNLLKDHQPDSVSKN